MKTFFIFFSICIVSVFASTPWLNENSTDSGISEGDIAFKDAPDSNEQTREMEDHQGHGVAPELIIKWENKIVPYNIHSNFTKEQRRIILAAMKEVEASTCISFVERKQHQKDYVFFKQVDYGSMCSSIVGRRESGGRQHVDLTDECVERNTVLHELMHLLGFHHEHSRHDRDKYIQINLNHVSEKHHQNLEFKRKVDPLDLHLPYDYKSITHYPVDAYSIYTNEITIISKSPWFKIKADGLSDIDIWKIKYMYNCSNEAKIAIANRNCNEHADVTITTVPNIGTSTVDQQRKNETNESQRTTNQLPTMQNTNKQVQTTSSMTITETSIGTTSKMTTSTTTRPISILNEEIIKAVEVGNETTVRTLLNEGADVNVRRIGKYRSNTLLHLAAVYGHVNVVSLLLDKGANIEKKDVYYRTPLHHAARNGHVNVVSLLLDKRANIEAKEESNWTPLHSAARNGHVNVVSLLLDKGANIEKKDAYDWTPLHHAARNGHVNVVSLLLDKGANIEARSTSNWTPLHSSARNGHVNVVSLLLDKGANIEEKDVDDWTPLHHAARNGHVNVVSLLLDKGANIEARSTSNWTPLHSAARNSHVNVVSLLLDKGANIEARDTSNDTPLHHAAGHGHVNIVSLLLDKGANIESRDRDNWTPLHFAATNGHVNVVSLLLDNGANIFAKGHFFKQDETPLDLARKNNKPETVEILERKQDN